ncbi:MAG: hypothetical protein HY211_02460, partial [Candidatus Omnitrophica bacterium]|nr:hypothetical protein [Candidatus Omnitrophota bacterium]
SNSTTGGGVGYTTTGISGTGTIAAQGNVTVDGNNYSGTATLLINGTGNQTFTGSATQTSGYIPNVTINKPSGTLTLAGTIRTYRNWTYTAGTVDAGTSTVVFLGYSSAAAITGSHTLNNVTVGYYDGGVMTIASGTTLTVAGTLALSNSTTGGGVGYTTTGISGTGTIAAQGNVTVDGNNYSGTATLLINGTGDGGADLQRFRDADGRRASRREHQQGLGDADLSWDDPDQPKLDPHGRDG